MNFRICAFSSRFLPKPKVTGNARKTSDHVISAISQHTPASKLSSLGCFTCHSEMQAQGSVKFTRCQNAGSTPFCTASVHLSPRAHPSLPFRLSPIQGRKQGIVLTCGTEKVGMSPATQNADTSNSISFGAKHVCAPIFFLPPKTMSP